MNQYKEQKRGEYLSPPKAPYRGNTTTTDILERSMSENDGKELIRDWSIEVYNKWGDHHAVVDDIAKGFLKTYKTCW